MRSTTSHEGSAPPNHAGTTSPRPGRLEPDDGGRRGGRGAVGAQRAAARENGRQVLKTPKSPRDPASPPPGVRPREASTRVHANPGRARPRRRYLQPPKGGNGPDDHPQASGSGSRAAAGRELLGTRAKPGDGRYRVRKGTSLGARGADASATSAQTAAQRGGRGPGVARGGAGEARLLGHGAPSGLMKVFYVRRCRPSSVGANRTPGTDGLHENSISKS